MNWQKKISSSVATSRQGCLWQAFRYCLPPISLALVLLVGRISAATPNLEAGLLAHLPFTEDLRDHSVQQLPVAANGVVELRPEGAWFDGQTNWLELPHLPLNNRSFAFTLWLKLTGTGPMYGIFAQYGATEYNCWLHLMLRGGRQPYVGFLMNDAISPVPLTHNEWTHVVFQYNKQARRQEIWIDGRLICARNSEPYRGTRGVTTIGKSPIWSNVPTKHFVGFMRDVRIYGRALTAEDVHAVLKHSPPAERTAAVRAAVARPSSSVPLTGEASFTALAEDVGIPFLSIDGNKLVITGEANQVYEVLYTDDLNEAWKPQATLHNANGVVEYQDTTVGSSTSRFYRIKTQ